MEQTATLNVEAPKLYSARAVRLFSVLFTVVFGGVLLYQNLKELGNKAAARRVLLFSIGYTVLAMVLLWNIPVQHTSSLTLGINLIGGGVLSGYFFPKYIPDAANYPTKKVWKPLLISVLIALPFVLAVFYDLQASGK